MGEQSKITKDHKTCDMCLYGMPIGEGDLYCDKFEVVKEDYYWVACESGFEEE